MTQGSYTYIQLWSYVNGGWAYLTVANFSVFSHGKKYISEFLEVFKFAYKILDNLYYFYIYPS